MDKNIAIVLALAVVLGTFFVLPSLSSERRAYMGNLSLLFPTLAPESVIRVNILENTSASIEAWAAFEQYREYARTHNLPGLASLSYQLSPACADPMKVEECYILMDSVYFFSKGFKQSDFTNITYDERQIVMSTDYLIFPETEQAIKTVLYFVREKEPKILGIRFCYGEKVSDQACVETNKLSRDLNNNGWWDDVEAFFK